MSNAPTNATAADTIVLVHGLWLTPRSWENWIDYYGAKGYNVIAPAYPGFEVEVESLRADPTPIENVTTPEIVAHLERVIKALDKPPIIMGHSFGGTLVQILLDHGFGAAGVAIDSAPVEGILVNPVSQIRSIFPVLKNPANAHRAVPFTPKEFRYAFTNSLSDEAAAAAYERYSIGAPGSIVWGGILANLMPGHQDSYVNFKNEDRAPLLFIAGGEDHIMPPAVNKSNVAHYKSPNVVTDYHEFPGRCHFTCGQAGWEVVADYALDWAVKAQKS